MTNTELIHARAESARMDAMRLEMDSDHAYATGYLKRARRLSAAATATRALADSWER